MTKKSYGLTIIGHQLNSQISHFKIEWKSRIVQGVFLTGTPPKNSKYKKVNLG